jgi:hypothetical protein
VAESGLRISGADAGHRPPGQVAIVDQAALRRQGLRDLLIDQRPADLTQDLADGRGLSLGERLQGAPDAAVIGPARLLSGGGDSPILIQRAAIPADAFQVRQTSQNGHQELENLGLRTVDVGLLAQRDSHQGLDQAQMLRILAQQDEQGVFGVVRLGHIGAHGGSWLDALGCARA